jgi:hypothetical protein
LAKARQRADATARKEKIMADKPMPDKPKGDLAALVTLIILQSAMLLGALVPAATYWPALSPISAQAPYLAVSIASAAVAIIFSGAARKSGRFFCLVAGLLALYSFGPQHYFSYQFLLIWPSVIGGQLALIALFIAMWRGHRGRDA